MAEPSPSTSESTSANVMGVGQNFSLGMIANTVEPFSGKSNVKRYFEKIEQRAKLDNWNEKTTLNIVKYRLIGDAYNFFRTDATLDEIEYKDFKNKFIKRFSPAIIPGQALSQLSKCHQRHDEDVSQFVMRLKLLGVDIFDEDLRTAQPNEISGMRKKVDQLLLNQFKTGLRKELLKNVGTTLMREKNLTIDRAEELAKQEELNDMMVNPRQANNRILNINRRNECYKCGKMGHFARDCWTENASYNQNFRNRHYDRQQNYPNADYNRNRYENRANRDNFVEGANMSQMRNVNPNLRRVNTGAVPRTNGFYGGNNGNAGNGNQNNSSRSLNLTRVSPPVPLEETWD